MLIKTIEEFDGLPEGSCIDVESETDTDYIGTWSFRGATIEVTVPKSVCEKPKPPITIDYTSERISKNITPESIVSIDGFKIDDIFYHYETIGSLYWGMHEYKVIKIGTGCMCHTPYYVELEFINNNGRVSTEHASSVEFKRKFSSTKKEAWKRYIKYLEKQEERYNAIIENLRKSRREALKEYNKEQ